MKSFYFTFQAALVSLAVWVLGVSNVHAQSTETFGNIGPYGGYQLETWSGDNGHGTWQATDARTDQTLNGKAITVRDGALTSPSISGGIDKLVLTTQRKFSGTDDVLYVVVNGDTVGSIPYSSTAATDSIENINVSGNFTLEIVTPGNGDRVAMDDLTWYPSGGPSTVSVTFQVDMSEVGAIADTVSVAGNFQVAAGYPADWTPGSTILTDPDNDSIYTITVQLPAGNYEFKYINGTAWGQDEAVPSACAQNNNRALTVGTSAITLTPVCFGSCQVCGTPKKMVTFQVDMSQQTVSPNGVHVAGSFQGWNASGTQLANMGGGIYSVTVMIDSGNVEQYKFLNGNSFSNAETVPSACGVPDGFGGFNREVSVNSDTVLAAILFGTCAEAVAGPPVYPIGMVTTTDTSGIPDSLGVTCEVRGTVISTNFRSGGLEFFIHDGTGGIGAFSSSNTFGYTVNIGDSVHIQGDIGHFNGLAQIGVDSLILAVANHRMPHPTIVDSLGEVTEAELIRMNNATLVNPGQWPNPGSNANVDIMVGGNTFTMRIDRDTDVDDNVTAPTGAFHVIGIGGQFDGSAPHTSGYQILPRMASDIIPSTVGVPCGDLFFSEYIEGSSSNKVLEIYNPTNVSVDLSNYTVDRYNNGSSSNPSVFGLSGMLAPGGVYVIANAFADSLPFLTKADTTGGATFYNGDDAVVLSKNGVWLDVIGEVGVDPGSSWPVGSGSTSNNTLVRKSNVNNGSLDWNIGATQWDVFASNFSDSLGGHTMTPCGVAVDPELAFDAGATSVSEYAGSTNVTVTIVNPDTDTTMVEVYVKGGSAVNGTDYTFSDTTLTFLPNDGNPQTLNIGITYDPANQPDRTIVLGLRNATNNATLTLDTTMVTIEDVPYYPIATVHTEDVNGVADSNGVLCELRGIVNSENIRPGALQFTFEDATGGMGLFNGGGDFGYSPMRGDSIHVIGTIGQFAGLTQISPDTVILISTGNDLPAVTQTDSLYEDLESRIVKLVGYHIIDPTQWTGSGSGFNVDITNGTDTLQVRIDADVDLYTKPVPTDSLITWVGNMGQFAGFNPPYVGGYQVLPRDSNDVMATQAPVAGFTYMEDPSLTVAFTDTSLECPTQWAWTFGDGSSSDEQHPTHVYAAKGTYEVCLTVSNPAGSTTICDSITVGPVGIDLAGNLDITVYPVPAEDVLMVTGDSPIELVRIVDVQGREVLVAAANGDTQVLLDVSSLASGIYVIEVKAKDGLLRQQITKQ